MDSRVMKPSKVLPKPLLLKDYLLDELSSCSSSGFESFPRRQCCTTTIRFLIEIDIKNSHQRPQKKNKDLVVNKTSPPCLLMRSPSKSALAAFHTVITAVKRFPFGGGAPDKKRMKKSSSLRRSLSLSMKIIEKSNFWKRKPTQKGIEQWKSFEELLKEDYLEPSAIPNNSPPGEFPYGNFPSEVELQLPYAENDVVEMPTNDEVSIYSTTGSENASSSTETKAKDRFSPVSVLDCPFQDEEEEEEPEVSSPFEQRLTHTEGTRTKLAKRIQKPEFHFQLDLVNLMEKFTDSDNEYPMLKSYMESASEMEEEEEEEKEGENRAQKQALDLLNHMKDTIPSYGIKVKADKLLLDFFMEQLVDRKRGGYSFEEKVLEEAESWINGRMSRELFLEWNVPSHREVYAKEMEKRGEWRSLDLENEDVAVELEGEVLAVLLNELLVDHLICQQRE